MSVVEPELRLELDAGVRRFDGGRTLLGGSPLRVVRLSDAGCRQLDRWSDGEPVRTDGPAGDLARRLIDGGLAHPRWSGAPYGPADVTVVIPVRDDAEGLAATIAALGEVGAVVVVDDGSADPVSIRSAAGAAEVVRRPRSGGPGAARETGRAVATTPLLAFVDADCRPEPGWLDALLPHLSDPAVMAAAPRIRSEPGASALARYEAGASPIDLGDRPARVAPRTTVAYVPTACLLVRAGVPAFDPALRFGEDVDLVWRIVGQGGTVRYEPSATVWHRPRSSWWAWVRQRVGYGSAAAPLARRHPGAVAPLVISRWSAVAWGSVLLRRPALGVLVAAISAVALPRRLVGTGIPPASAVTFALAGHARAGRWISSAVLRPWWPVALGLGVLMRRSRVPLLLAAILPATVDWLRRRPRVDPVTYVTVRAADDLAYGVGVWIGCARERSAAALVPELIEWPGRGGATTG